MTADDPERRIARLEAREEIRALLVEYARALDAKDFHGYAALFTTDGRFVGGGGRFVSTGADEIVAMLEEMIPEYLAPAGGDDQHLVCNVEIEILGDDEARASSTWVYLVRGEGDVPQLAKVGHYEDELRREDGRWRFARRRAPALIPVP